MKGIKISRGQAAHGKGKSTRIPPSFIRLRRLDRSGWIEIIHAGDNAEKFAKALSGPAPLILSTIHLYEIARVANENATSEILTFLQLIYATSLRLVFPCPHFQHSPGHVWGGCRARTTATAASTNRASLLRPPWLRREEPR